MKKFLSAMLLLLLLFNASTTYAARDISITLNGENIQTDVEPYIKDDRTLVPIRFISEALGYDVDWDEVARKVTVKNDSKKIELTIGEKNAVINDAVVENDVAPEITGDRTFVPVRFIAENFGVKVDWDPENYVVILEREVLDDYAQSMTELAEEFQRELALLRQYYFQDFSKYSANELFEKFEIAKSNINGIINRVESMGTDAKYEKSYEFLKEAMNIGRDMLAKYNDALLSANQDAAKQVIDLQTRLAIKISEFKSALDAESKGLQYVENQDIKSFNDADKKDGLLQDQTIQSLLDQLQ
ncbi:MAG: copper amine oxidase N-terminal domain-containing protein [Peptoniphilus sp.]|nr:copper amine oxidase N-terminal domain-containing protein [Peptoniphilus sp.]